MQNIMLCNLQHLSILKVEQFVFQLEITVFCDYG